MSEKHTSLVVLGIEEIRRSKSEADIIGLIAAGATKKCLPPDMKKPKKKFLEKRKTMTDLSGPVKMPPPEDEPLYVADAAKSSRWSFGSLLKAIVRPKHGSAKKKSGKKEEKRSSEKSSRSSKSTKSESRTSDPTKLKKRQSVDSRKVDKSMPLDLFGGESKDDIDEELEKVIASGLPKSRRTSLGGDDEEEPLSRARSETDITAASAAQKQRALEIEAERRKRKSLDKRADLNFPRKSKPAVLITVSTSPTSTTPCPSFPASPSGEFEIKTAKVERLVRSKSSS